MSPSIDALQADVIARRHQLAGTVDELAARVAPQALVQQATDTVKAKALGVVYTPDGQLRVDRIAIVGGVLVVAVALRIWGGRRRARRRG